MAETGRKEKDLPLVENFETVRAITADGKSVLVPKSKFGGNLEIAKEDVLGGIKASPRDETDTQEVKIDPDSGKLYVPEGKGTPPDDEDITVAEIDGVGKLQLKDKAYDRLNYSGLGRTYLRRNISEGVNVLTQESFTNGDGSIRINTRYVVQYDYDLKGNTITIPEGCILQFDGGSISNGIIKGNNTEIEAGLVKVFGNDVTFSGTFNIEAWYPEWFGAVSGDETVKSTVEIQCALNAGNTTNCRVVELTGAQYYIDNTLYVYAAQTLRGNNDGAKHWGNNKIYQTANKHAISLKTVNDDATPNILNLCIKNITVENHYNRDSCTNCGIYVGVNKSCFGMMYCNFENVCLIYFDTGFFFDGYARGVDAGGFAYNRFDRLMCYYNNIGFRVKGAPSTTDSSLTRGIWCNLNEWNLCGFMQNRVGGVLFDGTTSQQENIFSTCAFEGNGRDYRLSDIDNHTYIGYAFCGKNQDSFGYTRFYNCYIEYNLPRRSKSLGFEDSGQEYSYGDWIFPNSIEDMSAFVCKHQSIEVSKNLLSKFVRLFYGYNNFGCRFVGNDYDLSRAGYKPLSDITIDHMFYFSLPTGYDNYENIYIDEHFPKKGRDGGLEGTFLEHVVSPFRITDGTISVGNYRVNTYVNHPLLDSPIEYKYTANIKKENYIKQGVVYINQSNGYNGLGATRIQPVSSFSMAEQVSSFHDKGKEVTWVLLGDHTLSSGENWSGYYYNPILLKGDSKDIVLNIKKEHVFNCDLKIENLTINLNQDDWAHGFFVKTNGHVLFENCTFNYANANKFLIRANQGASVAFNKCTFNLLDTSKGSAIDIANTRFANFKTTFVLCTYQDGVTVSSNTYYWYPGNAIDKAQGDIVLVKGTELCYKDSIGVVNMDGTLYNKVRRITGTNTVITSQGNGVRINKIVNDIDINGGTMSLPWDCVLDFQGGKFTNGTLSVNRARLMPMGMPMSYYIDTDTVTITGNYWATGQTIYDTELKKQKLWNGTAWVNLDGTPLTDTVNTVEEQTE